jgi:hypothetical protein
MMQSFLPFYLKILPGNFLELPTDYACALTMFGLIVFQIIMLRSQQVFGARWFVPKRFRKDPNAYDYNRRLDSNTVQQE